MRSYQLTTDSMAFPTVLNPYCAFRDEYPDASTIETFANISVKNIVAPISSINSLPQTLLLGATSNIVIESTADAKMYLRDNSAFTVWNSHFSTSGFRTDTTLMDLRAGTDGLGRAATVLSTGGHANVMMVQGSDAFETTWIGSAMIQNHADYTQLSTQQINGFLFNNTTEFNSNVVMDQDVYMKSTLEVDGNVTFYKHFFTPDVNIWADNVATNERVGFAFTINEKNQLQLIKYINGFGTAPITKTIAVFGNSPMNGQEKTDGTTYLVFDELSGVGVHDPVAHTTGYIAQGGSSDTGSGYWSIDPTGNGAQPYTFTSAAWVGVLTDTPAFPLDVNGSAQVQQNLTVGGAINANTVTAVAVTTTSDERLKDIRGVLDPSSCLDKLTQLDVIDFAYKASSPEQFKAGLRAQQVQSVMEDAIITKAFAGLDDCLLVDSSVMLAYIVGSIKELAAKVAAL